MIQDPNGLYLFLKPSSGDTCLKDMLQFLRSQAPGKSLQFAYVETESSLIPHLSLWENLHVVLGGSSWAEFSSKLESDWTPLIKLIQHPEKKVSDANSWEKLIISLLKGTLIHSQYLLVDMNEALHTPLNLSNFKKVLVHVSQNKNVLLASSNQDMWLDSAKGIISREGYEFTTVKLALPAKRRSA